MNTTPFYHIISMTLAFSGLILSLVALAFSRQRDFVTIWIQVSNLLQEGRVRNGRAFLRYLKKISPKDQVNMNDWLLHLSDLEREHPHRWTNKIPGENDHVRKKNLIDCAKDAYDSFDIAAGIIINSGSKRLREMFIEEYQDGIIATWEQGSVFLDERILESIDLTESTMSGRMRREAYRSFSFMYVLTLKRQSDPNSVYPHIPLQRKLKNLFERSSPLAKRAKALRDTAEKECLRSR